MAMNTVINTNIRALNSHRNLAMVGNRQSKASQRLSSGKKINSAADDAAGLAISDKMKAQIRGLDMAAKNSEDATSLIQTAEGSLTEVTNMVQRMRELTVQAANDTNTQEDRQKISAEITQLAEEVDSIAKRTEFNSKKLTDGSQSKSGLVFQIGANKSQALRVKIESMDMKGIGLENFKTSFASIATKGSAAKLYSSKLDELDSALGKVATQRANLGATQNRLEYTVNNLNVSSENLSAAKSRIEDTDMAKEMMNLTSANVLQQAATAMLAQANQAPQSINQLLG
ncbi:flagellin N-terminal helical domain-containing protein [[Clostridium] colinum]|uniref:flagellin N-terminal helical domain-containing protein n=1 Tax=[Clostridium] colinum TaxID=36835 RepID=UPI0024E12356|nr:flagellin [[Clostridium] colinum]